MNSTNSTNSTNSMKDINDMNSTNSINSAKSMNSINNIRLKLAVFLLALSVSHLAFGQVYIFVSYSMNDEALQSYYSQAQQHQAQLVMRGLKGDSFLATKNKAEQLKIVYDVNPELFDKYGVKEVPVIVYDDGVNVKKITGHILLIDAMRIMEQEQ